MTDYSENMRGLLLQDAFEKAVVGSRPPNRMVVGGAWLNQQLLTDRYDPEKSYQVSRQQRAAAPTITELT